MHPKLTDSFKHNFQGSDVQINTRGVKVLDFPSKDEQFVQTWITNKIKLWEKLVINLAEVATLDPQVA